MTKEQKILLLFVLAIAGSSATFYVVQQRSAGKGQPQIVTTDMTVPDETTAQANLQASTTVPATTTSPTTTASATVQVKTPVVAVTPAAAKNKTFKEHLTYAVPDGFNDELTVTAVLDASGAIVDVTFDYGTPTNRESAEYMTGFASAFNKGAVVGKKISTVHLSRVGGASITTMAFNKVMATISTRFNG